MSDQEASDAETAAGSQSDVERMMRYDASKKSTLMAYVIWLFFGGLAGHRFYLERYGSAVVLLLFSVVLIVLSIGVPGIVRRHNHQIIDRPR
jgi:TM2 domain-containing membrane protein YozV